MKKMKRTNLEKPWDGHLPHGMEDLSFEEKDNIKGAQDVWFWITYATGKIGSLFSGA